MNASLRDYCEVCKAKTERCQDLRLHQRNGPLPDRGGQLCRRHGLRRDYRCAKPVSVLGPASPDCGGPCHHSRRCLGRGDSRAGLRFSDRRGVGGHRSSVPPQEGIRPRPKPPDGCWSGATSEAPLRNPRPYRHGFGRISRGGRAIVWAVYLLPPAPASRHQGDPLAGSRFFYREGSSSSEVLKSSPE